MVNVNSNTGQMFGSPAGAEENVAGSHGPFVEPRLSYSCGHLCPQVQRTAGHGHLSHPPLCHRGRREFVVVGHWVGRMVTSLDGC